MTFDQWEIATRIALSDRGVGPGTATPLIEDARAHCASTGEDPSEALGAPDEFAEAAAAEVPAELREEVDRQGLTVTDHLTGGLVHLAGLLVLASGFFAVLDGTLWFPVSPAALTGWPLLALGMIAAGSVPGALRAAGRPGWAKYGFVAAGALGVAAATAFTTLSREPLGSAPALGLVAAGVVALVLLLRRSPARPSGPEAHDASAPDDPEAWLSRLTRLLIGRHDLPPARAAELTREARSHLDATGATPADEFGPLAAYARRLAEHEPARREPWWRTTAALLVSQAAGVGLGVLAFTDWLADGHRWAAYLIAVPGTAALAWQLLSTVRLSLRRRPDYDR